MVLHATIANMMAWRMGQTPSRGGASAASACMPPKGADKAAKRAEREAKAAAELAKLTTVRAALKGPDGAERDLLDLVRPFCAFDREGIAASLSFCTPATMTDDVRSFVFDLTKANMEAPYVEAGWGWNDGKKRRELYDPDARFIVFRRNVPPPEVGELIAFAHMRFMVETGIETLYVYEIQVKGTVRRAGLGKHLMQVMELIGFKVGMRRIMLTVLKCNPSAVAFYKNKLKYRPDDSSPSTEVDDDAPYEILSKSLERKAAAPAAASASGGASGGPG